MKSMNNNWLGFSLSPSDQNIHRTGVVDSSTATTAVDVTGEYCYDMTAASDESSAVQTSFPSPFGVVLDAITRDNNSNVVVQEKTNVDSVDATPKKTIESFGQRTSIYRGVTRHRWTGRYEAHLWDNSCKREGQARKGRQGGYDKEEKAARAYDLAALKYWGTTTTTNFPISEYEKEVEDMNHMTRQEYVASLRRKSSGFSRGASIYRGVTRHHQHGRWQARIGRVAGNKDLYLGTFGTQEEAAEAYDIAAIKFRGLTAVTNFEMSRYNVKAILDSPCLPIGSSAKRLKEVNHPVPSMMINNVSESENDASGWQNAARKEQEQSVDVVEVMVTGRDSNLGFRWRL
ncbi:hypothetical protein F2Q70_00014426 [Brassica cretica]|uniref:AP2/ERF domain-containing protein n=1 Tax=Brassica cretica TaxID=69181 RepID=A0A8S9I653_BRACR|nr:hypothetical protein F2Q70_00014426 [Brassica cretica]